MLTFSLFLPFLAVPCRCLAQNQPELANSGGVFVQLSLEGGSSYTSGEPIVLALTFIATEPGHHITTSSPLGPEDQIVLSPMVGVFPWAEDQTRGGLAPYATDVYNSAPLNPYSSFTMHLPLNGLFRFDQAGHYTVHVVTHRIDGMELTSNDVGFDVALMADQDEQTQAALLENAIRSAVNIRTAQDYADQLNRLSGDPSTRAKLNLFLHPKSIPPYQADVSKGLWIARNRSLVVSTLEQAMSDPQQPIDFLATAIALKARLASPYDASSPHQAPPADLVQSITRDYVQRVAATLPQRSGDSLMSTALTLFRMSVNSGDTSSPVFQASREAVIVHFADVGPYNVDWVLNSYGKYLLDERMIPALQNVLLTQRAGMLSGAGAAALKQLYTIAPEFSRQYLVDEICDPNVNLTPNQFDDAPFESLPEADACLKEVIQQLSNSAKGKQVTLGQKAELVNRFASPAIYDDLLAIYQKFSADWSGDVRAGFLGYFARYDAKRAKPLLEAALPEDVPQPDLNVILALLRGPQSPALEDFFRERLASAHPDQVIWSANALEQHGTAGDETLIRARLERWTKEWPGPVAELPVDQARLQAELILALLGGKSWHLSEDDAATLRSACISQICQNYGVQQKNKPDAPPPGANK